MDYIPVPKRTGKTMRSVSLNYLLPLIPRLVGLGILLVVCGFFTGRVSAATSLLLNYDFSSGLTDWTTIGDVQHVPDFAVVIDDLDAPGDTSILLQSVDVGPEVFNFEFDFDTNMSPVQGPGNLLDTAFITLYFSDTAITGPADLPGATGFLALFDVDANGIFNVAPMGAISSIPMRPGWSRFAISFDGPSAFVTPVVEVLDQNMVDGDSSFAFDTAILTVVPEPASLVLVMPGLFFVLLRRGRKD